MMRVPPDPACPGEECLLEQMWAQEALRVTNLWSLAAYADAMRHWRNGIFRQIDLIPPAH